MKKRAVSVLVSLALLCSVLTQTAYAVQPRDASISMQLSFDGTTACCGAICRGYKVGDQLEVTLTLYQGGAYVDSWSASGKTTVSVSGQHEAESGKTYELIATLTINGVEKPEISTTKTCP